MPTNFNLDADLAEARSRRDAIKRNLETLHRDAGGEELRGGDGERWEISPAVSRASKPRSRALRTSEQSGTPAPTTSPSSRRIPGTSSVAAPMPEPRDGSGDNPRMSRVRSDALRANERAEFMPERCRESMEQALRADDDPENRLARYVVETS